MDTQFPVTWEIMRHGINITNNEAAGDLPAWSPDGAKIAFQTERDGLPEVYVMDADGASLVNITNNSDRDGYPTWSSDGTQIAFHTFRDGNWEIYVVDADGANPVNITNNSASDTVPHWSPVVK